MAYINDSQFHIKQNTEVPFNVDVFMNDGTHRKRKISLSNNNRRHKNKEKYKDDIIKPKKIDKKYQKDHQPLEKCSSVIFSDDHLPVNKDIKGVDVSFWDQCNSNREAFELNYIQNKNDINFDEYTHYLQRKKEKKAHKSRKEKSPTDIEEKIEVPLEESKSVTDLKTQQKIKKRTNRKQKVIRIENDPIKDIFESQSFLQLNANTSDKNVKDIPPYLKAYLDEVNNMMDAKLKMFFKNMKVTKKKAHSATKNPLENTVIARINDNCINEKSNCEVLHDSRKITLKPLLYSQETQVIPIKEDVTTQMSNNYIAIKSNHDLKKRKNIKQSSLLNIPEEHLSLHQLNEEEPIKLNANLINECKNNNVEVRVSKSVGTNVVECNFEKKKPNLVCETRLIVEIPPKPRETVDDYIESKKNSLPYKRYYSNQRTNKLYATASDCHKPFMGSTDTSDKNSEDEELTEDIIIRSPPPLSSKTSNNNLKHVESMKKITLSPINSYKKIKKYPMRASNKFYKKYNAEDALLESNKHFRKMYKHYYNLADLSSLSEGHSSYQYNDPSIGSESDSDKRTHRTDKRHKNRECSAKQDKTCKDKKCKKKYLKNCSCQCEKSSSASSEIDEKVKNGKKFKKTTSCQYSESESSTEFRKKEKKKHNKNKIQNVSSQSDSELMMNLDEKFKKPKDKTKRNRSAGVTDSRTSIKTKHQSRKHHQRKDSEDREKYIVDERQYKNKNSTYMEDSNNKRVKKNDCCLKNKTVPRLKLSKSDMHIGKLKNSSRKTHSSRSDVNLRSTNQSSSKINSILTLDRFEKNCGRNCVPLYQQIRNNCLMLTKDYKKTDSISAYDKRKMYDNEMKKKRWRKRTDGGFTNRQYEVRYITVDTSNPPPQEDIIKEPINDTPKHVAVHYKHRTFNKKDEAITCKIIETPKTPKFSKLKSDYFDLLYNYNYDNYLNLNGCNLFNNPLEDRYYPFIDDLRWKLLNVNPIYPKNTVYNRSSFEIFKAFERQRKKKKISIKFHPKSYINRCRRPLKNHSVNKNKKINILMFNNGFHTNESSLGSPRQKVTMDQSLNNTKNDQNMSLIGAHLSCPTIRNPEPMFDFLYDDSSEITDVLQPLHTVTVTPATVFSPRIRKQSSTDSQSHKSMAESGYNSVNSRKHFSFTNFFKQPNIMALFHPPETLNTNKNTNNVLFFDHKKDDLYQKMAQECKSYVNRAREHCETDGKEHQYEEIPLSVILRQTNSKTDKKSLKALNINEIFVRNNVSNGKSFIELVPIKRSIAEMSSEDGNLDKEYEEMSLNDILGKTSLKMTAVSNQYSTEAVSVGYQQSLNNKSSSYETLSSTEIHEKGLKLEFFKSNENLRSEITFRNTNIKFHNFESLCNLYHKLLCLTLKLSQDEDFFQIELINTINEMNAHVGKKRKLKNLFKRKMKTSSITSFASSLIHGTILEQIECPHLHNKLHDLQMLASNAKRYYLLLVHAVRMNQSIADELKIYGFLGLLERIENGDYTLLQSEDEAHFQLEIKMQIKRTFLMAYNCCLQETKKRKRNINEENINLIRILASRFNVSSDLHVSVIARSIGKGFIKTETQLKAGLIYLIRMNTNELNEKDFQHFCHVNNYN